MHHVTTEPPWYQQFWPWLLIALPASAVLACAVTVWLIIKNPEREVALDAPLEAVNDVLGKSTVVPPKH
jgi:FixH